MPGMEIDSAQRYQEAIDAIRKRVPISRSDWDMLTTSEREHAFTVSQVTEMRVLQDVLDAVDSAVEKGTTLDDFRDECAAQLIESWGGEIPGRIENIFRTNVLTSYAEGRHAINSAPAVREARPIWRYDDVQSDRECETCLECGGTTLPADDPWWVSHHPPLHYQCMCTITALSPEEAAEAGYEVGDEAPEVEVDEGFGAEPSSEGKDWEPDLSGLAPELREELEDRLSR